MMGDLKDSLKFPDLAPIDHPRHCQQYNNVLNRSAEDMITIDEIDNLQMDLETLLAAASSRMRQLYSEMQILSDVGDARKDKKKEIDAKRLKAQDERPSKKLKTDSSSNTKYPNAGSSSGNVGRPKTKGTPSKVQQQEFDIVEEQQSYQPTRVPVNDTPSKFWQSVDPFCQPMQHETIRMLEQMHQNELDMEEYFKIPDLGVHFSQRWALEDMREEQGEGNRANVKKFDKSDDTVHAVIKKANDSVEPDDSCPYGSLTQRLISAFVEENVMAPPDSSASMVEAGKGAGGLSSSLENASSKPSKPLSIMHSNKLEARIKMELIEQGILEPETADSKKEDEILNQLQSCQQELKAVSKQNRDILQQLLQAAKEEMKTQEVRKKLESANTEVMEHYRRVMSARQKKRTLLKKEKDSAWKALRDRDTLVKQLE